MGEELGGDMREGVRRARGRGDSCAFGTSAGSEEERGFE